MIRDITSFPNLLTMLRLMFIPLIIITILDNNYRWAFGLFVLAGISDGLDGLLARALHQKTKLGEYLDPIADKLLLSTMFVMLSAMGKIPWAATVLVFSRDIIIVIVCAVTYATTHLRDFRPSLLGKANTLAQIATVVFVLLNEVTAAAWVDLARTAGVWATGILTVASGLHYVFLLERRIRAAAGQNRAAAK